MSNSKSIVKIIIFIVLFLLAVIILLEFNKFCRTLSSEEYYKGIYIDGIDVSGLNREEAFEKIRKEFDKNYPETSISLIYENKTNLDKSETDTLPNLKTWVIPLKSIDYSYDIKSALDYAYQIGREGSKISKLMAIKRLEKYPLNFIVSAKYNKEKLRIKLNIIKKEIDFSGKSSTYNYNYGRIIYTSDVEGRMFNVEKNIKLIEAHLLNKNFDKVCIEVIPQKPVYITADVKDLKDVLASYSTKFNKYNYSRVHNIELACKKINNLLLKPGEEFSMNLALGPRTLQNGYMQAPIILKNAMVQGTGGGICQVASTLYNSLLISRLKVTHRVNHSIPLGYVPPGQDATISEGYIDLKFQNNRDYTICIVSEVVDDTVNVKIIGRKRDDDPYVILKPVVLAEYDAPEPEYIIDNTLSNNETKIISEEKKGLRVILFRETYDIYGDLLNKEKISEDFYRPVRAKVAVNKDTYELIKK